MLLAIIQYDSYLCLTRWKMYVCMYVVCNLILNCFILVKNIFGKCALSIESVFVNKIINEINRYFIFANVYWPSSVLHKLLVDWQNKQTNWLREKSFSFR